MRFVTITEDMLDLGLNPSQLIVYAIIWGFSQDGVSGFCGSRAYLAKWAGVSERTVTNITNELAERGLIVVERENGDFNKIRAIQQAPTKKEDDTSSADDSIKRVGKMAASGVGKFTPPSVGDVAAYCYGKGLGVDAAQFVAFYQAKGWRVGNQKMKDWKAACRTWALRSGEKQARENNHIRDVMSANERRERARERARERDEVFRREQEERRKASDSVRALRESGFFDELHAKFPKQE